jgi:hypothetical protein
MDKRTRLHNAIVIGALAFAGATLSTAHAQPAPTAHATSFHLEWQEQRMAGQSVVKGSVQNRTAIRVTDVRLRVEALDGGGTVVGECFGWVLGDVPAAGTAYFVVPLTVSGAQYRVTVVSFDEVSRAPAGGAASP